jgi:hypothetical protein
MEELGHKANASTQLRVDLCIAIAFHILKQCNLVDRPCRPENRAVDERLPVLLDASSSVVVTTW